MGAGGLQWIASNWVQLCPVALVVPNIVTVTESTAQTEDTGYAFLAIANAFLSLSLSLCQSLFPNPFDTIRSVSVYLHLQVPRQVYYVASGVPEFPCCFHQCSVEEALALQERLGSTTFVISCWLTGSNKQQVAMALEQKLTHMKAQGWFINPDKTQGLANSKANSWEQRGLPWVSKGKITHPLASSYQKGGLAVSWTVGTRDNMCPN